jgi:GNAT superfamily N-acetyltransferase
MTTKPLLIRTQLRPGDLGAIIGLHGRVYAEDYGFDSTFEAYVAGPLGEFAERRGERERIWIAESGVSIVGSIAIVEASPTLALLRWYLVDRKVRGNGLGAALLSQAVAFCRAAGYAAIDLWTVSALTAAARLYEAAGFRVLEEKPGRRWGVDVVEQRYGLELRAS